MAVSQTMVEENTNTNKCHKLHDTWNLWAHLPHDTKWDMGSYIKVMQIKTVEDGIKLIESLPEELIKNCMLFLMRDGIKPTWEDPKNKHGGCFSYKISNTVICNTWRKLSYALIGETLSNNQNYIESFNGITISPKKHFCIVKVWMSNCKNQNVREFTSVPGLISHGCIFKKHKPNM